MHQFRTSKTQNMPRLDVHTTFIIKDWAGNTCFDGEDFSSFEAAEAFLSEQLGDDYDTDRQEYEIEEV